VKRLPLFILVWLAYAAIMIPLTVLGILVVAVLACFPHRAIVYNRESVHYKDGRGVAKWRWKWVDTLFGNDEDGVDGLPVETWGVYSATQERQQWWQSKTRRWSTWRRIFVWAGLRNSCANCRFLPFLGMVINPRRVESSPVYARCGLQRGWLAWQGYRAGLRWRWSRERAFWIGWKVKPADAWIDDDRILEEDTRYPGVGFAFQPWDRV
jgi:hypothetical protein